MDSSTHPIRLVVGIELRPPGPGARYVLERDEAARIGTAIGDDLAEHVPEVTAARLVSGPALLEPGQVLSPDHAPWDAMTVVAGQVDTPGLTALGAVNGRLSHDTLASYREAPRGLFVCLPLLLFCADEGGDPRRQALDTALERTLFDAGGLRPPAMGELARATGLEPVHGQLMTLTDLAALVKMQLAGAGLDPFWPPVEHALLSPETGAELELPAGLQGRWNTDARGWELALRIPADPPDGDDALWLRAFRQTTALLENHLIPWRATVDDDRAELDPDNRWVAIERTGSRAAGDDGAAVETLEHPELGLIGFAARVDGRRRLFLPLIAEAVAELRDEIERSTAAGA